MVLKSIEISYLLGVALSAVLLLASLFLLVKVVRNNSFTFVLTQSIWCIVFAASYIALNLLNFVYYDKNSGWKQLSVYILGFSYAYATFIIFWNITLQYLVTSKQLERILKHNEGTEDPQVVIEKMQDDNMFYKK